MAANSGTAYYKVLNVNNEAHCMCVIAECLSMRHIIMKGGRLVAYCREPHIYVVKGVKLRKLTEKHHKDSGSLCVLFT